LLGCATTHPAANATALSPATPAADQAGAARRPQAPVHGIDHAAFERVVDARLDEVLARPTLDAAMERLMQGVAEDPALAAAGESVFTGLADAPELKRQLEALQEELGNLPELTQLAESLVASHPQAGPDDMGGLVERHIDARVDGKDFDAALDVAIDRLFEQRELDEAFEALGAAVSDNPHVRDALTKGVAAMDEREWERRLAALNGGVVPDEARTLQLLSEHVFKAERLERLLLDWLGMPEVHGELVRLCRELLETPQLRRHLVALVSQLLSDPSFKAGTLRVFALLVAPELEPRALTNEVQRALDNRRVAVALAAFLDALRRDAALQQVGDRYVARVAGSQGFARALQRFVQEW
jgi:hypothetical protein